MNKTAGPGNGIRGWSIGGIWRVVCSYNCREANGREGGITLATPKSASPLQAIEKKQLKRSPNLTVARRFVDGQWFGRNRKLLGWLGLAEPRPGST
jgi:hypothetical protein